MEGKKHKKRILSILMALCLVPTTAFAEGGVTLTGSGTAEELKTFRDKVNGGDMSICAKLMNDIVLNDGTFDEDGKYTPGASGGIAGTSDQIQNRCYMSNCYSVGALTYHGSASAEIRGIFGDADRWTITNCYWLKDTAGSGIGGSWGQMETNAEAKTKSDFVDGAVLALLKQNDTTNAWGSTSYLDAAKMTLPLLKGQAADAHEHGGDWRSDATGHWRVCSCGVIHSDGAHSGGTATSSAKAKCSTCGAEYGELASGGYYYYTSAADTKKPSPKTADESSMARGVIFKPSTHMATGMALISRSSTSSVASGVTSRGDRPVPPVVTIRSMCRVSAQSRRAATAGPLVPCRGPRLPRSLMVSTAAV